MRKKKLKTLEESLERAKVIDKTDYLFEVLKLKGEITCLTIDLTRFLNGTNMLKMLLNSHKHPLDKYRLRL